MKMVSVVAVPAGILLGTCLLAACSGGESAPVVSSAPPAASHEPLGPIESEADAIALMERILSVDGRYEVSGTGRAELVSEAEAFETLNEIVPKADRIGSSDVMVWLVYYEGTFFGAEAYEHDYGHGRRWQVFYQDGDFGPAIQGPCNEDAAQPCYLPTPSPQDG